MSKKLTILTTAAICLAFSCGQTFGLITKTESFDSQAAAEANGWVSGGNPPTAMGWRSSNNAGGAAPGEAGGDWDGLCGNMTVPKHYADITLGDRLTEQDTFSASGVLKRGPAPWADNAAIGHFCPTVPPFESKPSFVGLIVEDSGGGNDPAIKARIQAVGGSAGDTTGIVQWTTQPVRWNYTYDGSTGTLTVYLEEIANPANNDTLTVTLPSNSEFEVDSFGIAAIDYWQGNNCNDMGDVFIDDVEYTAVIEIEKAKNPSPYNGAMYVARDVVLSWLAGAGATAHDVYFGTDAAAVDNATGASSEYQGRQSGTSFDPEGVLAEPEDLVPGTTYYWRVDEIEGANIHKGYVWSFTADPGNVYDIGSKCETFDSAAAAAANGWAPGGSPLVSTLGWQDSNNAGGDAPGEAGGDWDLHSTPLQTSPKNYADTTLGVTLTDQDRFSASGRFWRNTPPRYADNASIGHFVLYPPISSGRSHGAQIPFVGIVLDEHGGGGPRLFAKIIGDNGGGVVATTPETAWTAGLVDWEYIYDPVTRTLTANFTHSGTTDTISATLPENIHFNVDSFGLVTSIYWTADNPDPQGQFYVDDVCYTSLVPEQARWPSPIPKSKGVSPDVVLTWTPGVTAASHDVYFGTVKGHIAVADTTWGEYRGNQSEASYDPPETLELGRTYYWRIDEVNGPDIVKGAVFEFTVDAGMAANPAPADKAVATTETWLSWTAGLRSTSHNVYIGTDPEAVADATGASPEFAGNTTDTFLDPGTLAAATRYYWRVDEVGATDVLSSLLGPDGAIKGRVWTFVTPGYELLNVDLALPGRFQPGDPSLVKYNLATAKDGWTIWPDQRWWDIYMHDWVNYPNIGDTGINAALSTVYDGEGGLKVYNMCMENKAGGGTNGPVVGDPIANSWYYAVDHVNAPRSSLVLCLQSVPAGEYWMTSYHNYWEPCSGTVRECTQCGNDYGQGMQFVRAMSMQEANTYYAGAEHNILPGMTQWAARNAVLENPVQAVIDEQTGGITSLADQVNVMPTHVTSDASVKTSLIKFTTDGSPFFVAYEPAPYQDTGDQYKGPRGVLNAFQIQAKDPVLTSGRPVPADGETGVQPSALLIWTPGAQAARHDVYLGTDATAVANATTASSQYKGNLPRGTESYDPQLTLRQTYYWRIDEVGADGTIWPGTVWSFTMAECAYIDNFEYGVSWIGLGSSEDDGSGPYVTASTDNPHSGSQSMEVQYLNTATYGSYGEAGKTFAAPANWLTGSATLGLYYRGMATNSSHSVRMYVRVEDADGASAEAELTGVNLQNETWQSWAIPLADLAGIDLSRVAKAGVGVGDRAGSTGGENGSLFVDDIGFCRGRCVAGPSQDLTGDCLVNFDDHAIKAQAWANTSAKRLDYKLLAEQWLEEVLIWP